uniref:Uncharacterized protein n=1 Tax=Spermophilus dauricus TaxID=99837 RepID=A0A8C9NYU8_SPEDA
SNPREGCVFNGHRPRPGHGYEHSKARQQHKATQQQPWQESRTDSFRLQQIEFLKGRLSEVPLTGTRAPSLPPPVVPPGLWPRFPGPPVRASGAP